MYWLSNVLLKEGRLYTWLKYTPDLLLKRFEHAFLIVFWGFFVFCPQLCHHSCLKITKYEAREPQTRLPPSLWPDSLPRIPLGARHGSVLIVVVAH